jgi:hypothetical protein
MIYIQIPEEHDAIGFLALAKSGIPLVCFRENSYGVANEHLSLLNSKQIPFTKLDRQIVDNTTSPRDEEF